MYLICNFPSLKIDIEDYPAVKEHLLSFGYDRLKQTGERGARKKTNNKWFETQDSISYWDDFSKQKIIYPDIMRLPRNINSIKGYPYLYLDKESFYIEATNFMMTGCNIDIIFLFLVSDLGFYSFSKYYSGPQFDSTGFRYKKAYLEEAHIPIPDLATKDILREFIEKNDNTDFANNELNKIWFKFIGLDDSEIDYVNQYKSSLIKE